MFVTVFSVRIFAPPLPVQLFWNRSHPVFNDSGSGSEQNVPAAPAQAPPLKKKNVPVSVAPAPAQHP